MDRIQSKAARLQQIEHRLYNTPQGVRVVELAEHCGVDRRTIYRDLTTLGEMGVPVWEHEGRYGIDREFYLSTVRLNLNEAIALFLQRGSSRTTATKTTRMSFPRSISWPPDCPTQPFQAISPAPPT
jgi:predicted DNA-binding transcriptional regulator YafY